MGGGWADGGLNSGVLKKSSCGPSESSITHSLEAKLLLTHRRLCVCACNCVYVSVWEWESSLLRLYLIHIKLTLYYISHTSLKISQVLGNSSSTAQPSAPLSPTNQLLLSSLFMKVGLPTLDWNKQLQGHTFLSPTPSFTHKSLPVLHTVWLAQGESKNLRGLLHSVCFELYVKCENTRPGTTCLIWNFDKSYEYWMGSTVDNTAAPHTEEQRSDSSLRQEYDSNTGPLVKLPVVHLNLRIALD